MHNTSASEANQIVNREAGKHARRLLFKASLDAGCSIAEASRRVGVSRETGSRWKRRMQDGSFAYASGASSHMAKEEKRILLAEIARSQDVSPAYRVNAISLDADLVGDKAPSRSLVEVRTVPASVVAWLDAAETEATRLDTCDTQPALPASTTETVDATLIPNETGATPQSGTNEIESVPLTISENSEKADS